MKFSQFTPDLQNSRFDYYRATFDEAYIEPLMHALSVRFPDYQWIQLGRGHNYYQSAWKFMRSEDDELLRIEFGGESQKKTAQVECKGFEAQDLYEVLYKLKTDVSGFDYKVKRVDSCINWEEEGLFDVISNAMIKFATDKGIYIEKLGIAWEGAGKGKDGRTLYLGSRKNSIIHVCLYEKGLTMGGMYPNWIRLEPRYAPEDMGCLTAVELKPVDIFRIGWVAEMLNYILIDLGGSLPVGRLKRVTSKDQKLFNCVRQYGKLLRELAAEAQYKQAFADILLDAMKMELPDTPPIQHKENV